MNRKYPGYSEIKNPTDAQIVEFSSRVASGELARFFLADGNAYIRRARRRPRHPIVDTAPAILEPFENSLNQRDSKAAESVFTAGPTDPADRLVPRRFTPTGAVGVCRATAGRHKRRAEWLPSPLLLLRAVSFGAMLAVFYRTWKPS